MSVGWPQGYSAIRNVNTDSNIYNLHIYYIVCDCFTWPLCLGVKRTLVDCICCNRIYFMGTRWILKPLFAGHMKVKVAFCYLCTRFYCFHYNSANERWILCKILNSVILLAPLNRNYITGENCDSDISICDITVYVPCQCLCVYFIRARCVPQNTQNLITHLSLETWRVWVN